jgi:DNA-directed RNA polymerase specialized sigma24 family protein
MAVGDLPARQREVVTLRGIEGLTSDEVCGVLEISDANQRVLLHRAAVGCGRSSGPSSGGPDHATAHH